MEQPILVPHQRHPGHSVVTSAKSPLRWELGRGSPVATQSETEEAEMARAGVLWLLGIPIPILLLMWAFGWLH